MVKKAYIFFFVLGVFFLPFNSQIPKWLGFLGEYSSDSSPIFFLISFLFLIFYSLLKGKIYIPLKSLEYNLFLIFCLLLGLATIINLPHILDYYFKQTTGINRFIRQLLSLLMISVVFFIVFINVCREYGVSKFFFMLRKIFFISFIIVFSCGIIEFIIITFNLKELIPVVKLFDYLPFVDIYLDFRLGRVSSTTFEPPALSSYLLTISGFMFSYIFTSKKPLRFLPFLMVVLLALLTKSRTAFVIIIVQIVFGVYYSYNKYPKFKTLFTKAMMLGMVVLVLGVVFKGKEIASSIEERIEALNFANNLEFKSSENAVSNKSRLGIQYANFQVFKENPVFGTGWGQQTFQALDHYPDWALKHNYEFKTMYLNEEVKSFPPGYNMYLRILTETGIVGFIGFSLFLYVIIKRIFIYYKTIKRYNYIVIALIISFFGYFLNWLQIDSFRLYGFWICLAILIMLKKEKND
ncbi:O-antigen ligase family protein [Winogradskyella sediminis]|uniref:O-antigen ligase family protein n=1 Tax=Winogradskyella sediminis TaxID=1382466 RepID=UPI000E392B2D|nr:O-antigen ligase family protein [Winogradskyella sediminis]REG89316.1 O-antigen ligase [Winogradskyella sediminis]